MKNYIYDGIMGVCIGDAVGVPYEFCSSWQMKQSPATDMVGGGTHGQPVGTWSDDSSMMLCLADSLAPKFPKLDYKDIMIRFESWLEDAEYTATGEVFDCGMTCGRAIGTFRRGYEPLLCGGYSENSNGNGSLMRILPLAFYIQAKYPDFEPNEEAMQWIDDVSSLTHAHKRSVVACGIYICMALEIMKCGDLQEGIKQGIAKAFTYYQEKAEYASELSFYERIKDPIQFAKTPEDEIKSGGYVVETLETAVWALMSTDNYKDAILRCVNRGDDTDTTAAVAGGLAGLYYELPSDWLEKLQNKELIADICTRLEKVV